MTCDKCPNLKPIERGFYECALFVDKNGNQMLDKHSLWNKVQMKSKPRYCEVDDEGKELEDD